VAGANAVYLNDIVIGPDGAAYATNSNTPEVYRIAREHGQWRMRLWAKPANVVQTGPFGLNGIEVAPDGRSLVAVQSDKGALWRFDLRTRKASRIGAGTVDLTSGDGLVVRGTTLVVIRNNPHKLVYLRLTADARSARLLRVADTDPTRVFTTGDYASGRLLLIDSKFDEQPPKPPYQVVSLPYQPR
jgi:sugar lactone lactonase YvrE